MEEIDYNKFYYILERYGARPNIQIKIDTHDLFGYTSTAIAHVAGRQTITMDTTFFDRRMFDQFVKDVSYLQELIEDERVRNNNPTVQQAYEEYQLLLKLSK